MGCSIQCEWKNVLLLRKVVNDDITYQIRCHKHKSKVINLSFCLFELCHRYDTHRHDPVAIREASHMYRSKRRDMTFKAMQDVTITKT
jgi:hypothetical protein